MLKFKKTNFPNYLSMLFLAAILVSCSKPGGVRILKLGHGLDTSHPVHAAMLYLAEKAEEKSNGKMIVQVYPNQQLGTERELVELLQIGSLAMTKVSTAAMEGFAPEIKILGQPYLFRDDEQQAKVLEGPIGKQLLAAGEKYWLKGLCFYDGGKRSFYTKDKPVMVPSDIEGLKIRVMESPTAVNMVQSFGGSPTPVSFGELYTALQQGIVDGAENNPPSFVTSRHYEVCKYYSLNEHTAIPDMMIVSTKVWDLLSEEERTWLQEAADESAVYQYKLWEESVAESMKILEEAGVEVLYPDKEPFRKEAEKVYELMKESDPEMYKLVQEIRKY
ncbi:TRAP transporter substrate-binding protein [Cyclobacterium amurskyense]|jgi:tripartite ATP-independent transporter DctP family solute receptor|uniref:TRAP-type C4-dicarboxylate transport system, periplasmic component n=1 Tax=Cyclobacterium amurskyense TaxID=320787 RepID=A0A0H4PJN9_9BACT|nr:TRAP transporter substrate-binding protein [Cyclobacterium amurskyense]AKP53158.1 TRAP-type C4-dicarboxylate transport system, periplasmic component [Cyclobacterium amurskyense]|tara:strand:+ start:1574 stop:2569 length:996 start_codon:yes stop_codon:yes gene_type:complete